MDRIVIIDGNSLINRAYYAIQKPMITRDGFYTQGIFGFLSMLGKIRNDYNPTHMLVAFDRKAPTFRHIEYADYKAGRKRMPVELAMEMPVLKDVLHANGIRTYEIDGFEADDIIGTTAKMAEASGMEAFVITGDRDALQLATDTTKVVITKKGITDFKLYDDAAMIEEYGFDHIQFIDYKGLRGDTSDNIPGLPGVGEKTATALIKQFGSVENIIAHSDEIASEKVRRIVEENAMSAVMSKKLATIVTNVPVDYTLEDLKIAQPDTAALIELYTRLEFRKYLAALDPSDVIRTEEAEKPESFEIIYDNELFLSHLKDGAFVDFSGDDSHVSIPCFDELQVADEGKVFCASFITDDFLMKAFSGKTLGLCGYNLQRLYYALLMHDIDISGLHTEFDVSLADYVLSPNTKEIAAKYADAGEKFAAWELLKKSQIRKIKDENLDFVLYNIEFPLSKVLAEMEAAGMYVDKESLAQTGQKLSEKASLLEKEIYELAGETFNISSPKQLGTVLFEKLGLPSGKKTKSGYSTSAEVLDKLAEDYPIVEKILDYRTVSKLNSTYVEGLIPLIDDCGKVHPHFQQRVTSTGRLSCTEPNLQNIPVRKEEGRMLRHLFTAGEKGNVLVGADYSQIELRVMAHMSGDPALIDCFNKGLDIHRETASKVFGVPENEVTDLMRSNAKAVNFGVIYGMSSFGLSGELSITRKQAEKYIQDYFERFEAVKVFLDKCVDEAKTTGAVRTLYGRKRAIPEINASAFMVRQLGERLAMNTPIQGTAADIIKLAMIKVNQALKEESPESKMILQVHDELIIQTAESEADKVLGILERSMQEAAELSVKLEVSSSRAFDWYNL